MRPPLRTSDLIEATAKLFKKVLGIDQQVFWLSVVMLAFLSVLAATGPLPEANRVMAFTPTARLMLPEATSSPTVLRAASTSTANPSPVTPTDTPNIPTPTPFPPELVANREQTNGIILGTVVLVLIIIGGPLAGIRTRSKE